MCFQLTYYIINFNQGIKWYKVIGTKIGKNNYIMSKLKLSSNVFPIL